MEELIVEHITCNDETFRVLELSSFVNLKLFEVGKSCFKYVTEVKLIRMHALERVLIGKYCFRKSGIEDKSGHFYLNDCERLKELKIGSHSFEDYSVCEIVKAPSLEVIEMGELNEMSANFYYASLKLKSGSDEMK